ncbi:hypothetical protein Back11_61010 [Paenibacillus baekrokdamisoli]|uniref:Uncharacterized protein n=1 Tax=Paenibacillus baekrokdamisoli TaxID=1712516 RepID=A0A3G9J1W9_9BACL|nr:YutD-like domain-containing protein [Paenibacillus baekrokdamisoli]MBB3072172.1 uncharacterized protein YutD [Paenibacillus baekrokdamisoli]BBH24756.1 hypothetical protein Back11_61010 [Paenibacillus baekrokdamisoli]
MIYISGRTYELMHENKNGWNIEAFRERFSDVLERYDYVVGDWGYNQLRLKGFFRDNNPKVTRDSAFSSMVDYINEYCNFGCAYFVLHKQPESPKQGEDAELSGHEEDDANASEHREGSEEIYETGPSRTATVVEGEEGAQEYQQVKFLPRHQRDQRREFHHKNVRKDAPKETDKDQPPAKEGRKPFNKDRDKGAPRQQQGGSANLQQQERASNANERSERPERSDRGDRNERNRAKRQHFAGAAKAPVAAASETGSPQQQMRGKDQGPKLS